MKRGGPLPAQWRQKLLYVEAEELYFAAADRALRAAGHEVARATTLREAVSAVQRERFDRFLVEVSLGRAHDAGVRFLEVARDLSIFTPAIVLSAHITYPIARRLRDLGIEYFPKLGLEFEELARNITLAPPKTTSGTFERVVPNDPELEAARLLLRSNRPLEKRLARTRRKLVHATVVANDGNRSAAARQLGTTRQRVQVILHEDDD